MGPLHQPLLCDKFLLEVCFALIPWCLVHRALGSKCLLPWWASTRAAQSQLCGSPGHSPGGDTSVALPPGGALPRLSHRGCMCQPSSTAHKEGINILPQIRSAKSLLTAFAQSSVFLKARLNLLVYKRNTLQR